MKQIGNNIFASFDYEQPTPQDCQVRAIVLGPGGVGKSKFVNNLCNSSHKIGVQRKSITTELKFERCIYPDNGQFCICDSPGYSPDTMKRLVLGLTKYQWNTAFVEMKLSARYQIDTLPELVNIYKMFKNGTDDRVIFLVTHLDILNDPNQKEQILKSFKQSLEEHQIRNKVIIFSNEDSDFSKLAQVLYSCAVGVQKIKFELKPKFLRCLNEDGGQIIQELVLPPRKQKVDIIKNDDQIQPNLKGVEDATKIQIKEITEINQNPIGQQVDIIQQKEADPNPIGQQVNITKYYPFSKREVLTMISAPITIFFSLVFFFTFHKPAIDTAIKYSQNKQAITQKEQNKIQAIKIMEPDGSLVSRQINQQCYQTILDNICPLQSTGQNNYAFNISHLQTIILDSVQVKPVEKIKEVKIVEQKFKANQSNRQKSKSKISLSNSETNMKQLQAEKIISQGQKNIFSGERVSRVQKLMKQTVNQRRNNENTSNSYKTHHAHSKNKDSKWTNKNKSKSNYKNHKKPITKGKSKNQNKNSKSFKIKGFQKYYK